MYSIKGNWHTIHFFLNILNGEQKSKSSRELYYIPRKKHQNVCYHLIWFVKYQRLNQAKGVLLNQFLCVVIDILQ